MLNKKLKNLNPNVLYFTITRVATGGSMEDVEPVKMARIYWPVSKWVSQEPGYIIGWSTHSPQNSLHHTSCVACIIDYSQVQHPQELQIALQTIQNDPSLSQIHEYCARNPQILGVWNPSQFSSLKEKNDQILTFEEFISSHQSVQENWITVEYKPQRTVVEASTGEIPNSQTDISIFHPNLSNHRHGFIIRQKNLPQITEHQIQGRACSTNSQIIFYTLPSPDHYFSTSELNLNVVDSQSETVSDLEQILHQINASYIIESALNNSLESQRTNSIPEMKPIPLNGNNLSQRKSTSEAESSRKNQVHSKVNQQTKMDSLVAIFISILAKINIILCFYSVLGNFSKKLLWCHLFNILPPINKSFVG
jgi:hypothetical protein